MVLKFKVSDAGCCNFIFDPPIWRLKNTGCTDRSFTDANASFWSKELCEMNEAGRA